MGKNPLKILYDASILVDGEYDKGCRSGIYFVALNILNELLKRRDVEIVLYTTPSKRHDLELLVRKKFTKLKYWGEFNFILHFFLVFLGYLKNKCYSLKANSVFRNVFSYIIFRYESAIDFLFRDFHFLFSNRGFDVFFSPFKRVPQIFSLQKSIQKYTILYDVIPLKIAEYGVQGLKGWFGDLVKGLNSRDYYFAISESAKNDFCEFFPHIRHDRITTALLAANDSFCCQKDENLLKRLYSTYNLPEGKRFIFSLCTLEPRKNLERSVKTFLDFVKKNEINDMVYVLGGGAWNKFEERIKNSLPDPTLFDKYVVRAGYVADADLPIFYSNAEWFVYTSQYEGFGLPPLEAMQCGCPVITSNNTSLPEVVGDAGIMIDWDSDEQHVAAYEKYYFNENLRKENSRKGLERAKLFSWEKTVDQMVRVMKENMRT